MDASTATGWLLPERMLPEQGLPEDRVSALRVAFFSDALPERNGAGSYYVDLVEQLRQRGASAEVFQPARKPRPFSGLSVPMPGDPTQRLHTPNLRRIAQRFAQYRPQLVVAVTPGPFGVLGMALAQRHGCGFVSAFHTQFDVLSRMYWNPLSRRIATGYLSTLNRLLFSRSSTVLVHSAALQTEVRRLGAGRSDVMGTPLPTHFLDTPVLPRDGRLQRLIFAGRLAPEKNVSAVVDAARAIPELEFVIAGDGPERKAIARQTRSLANVRMTGWLDRLDLRRELDAADVLLLPSHVETFGSIAMEAMARGCLALVSHSAGIFQWPELQDGLFALHDGESLAAAIERLRAESPRKRRDKARRARIAARGLNDRTLAQWLELIAEHGR